MTLLKYVEDKWLPNHPMEPKTREKYHYYLYAHILPVLGPMRMIDIFPEHIREWITAMQNKKASPWVIQHCKSSILNAIFTTALNDQVTYIHPCREVKIPTVPSTPRTIITQNSSMSSTRTSRTPTATPAESIDLHHTLGDSSLAVQVWPEGWTSAFRDCWPSFARRRKGK